MTLGDGGKGKRKVGEGGRLVQGENTGPLLPHAGKKKRKGEGKREIAREECFSPLKKRKSWFGRKGGGKVVGPRKGKRDWRCPS